MSSTSNDPAEKTLSKLKRITDTLTDKAGSQPGNQRLAQLATLATRHSKYGVSPTAPVREILHMVGDKWTSLILCVLSSGKCRYSVLRELVSALSYEQSISHRVLTSKLRLLERDGLVTRQAWPSVPPRVDYELTELGRSLTAVVEGLFAWAERSFDEIEAARTAFDEAPEQNYSDDDL